MYKFFTLIVTLLALTACAGNGGDLIKGAAGPESGSIEELREFIMGEMRTKKITGLSIAVTDSEALLWSEGFGRAVKKNEAAFLDTTVSNVGSVSKVVTAAAVMRLVEEKKLDLDASVASYIPEFNPGGLYDQSDPITLRMLLNHESGLESDAFRDFYLGHEPPEDYPVSYNRAVEAVNLSGSVRPPYEIFSYCNLGFSLLGVIIERATGKSFQEAVGELVFQPLGMKDSSFVVSDIPGDRMAMGYLAGKPEPVPYIRDMPAGSLCSSSRDMARFLQSMLASYGSAGGLLEPGTVREMFTPSNGGVPSDLDFKVGLTWWIVDLKKLPGEFIVGHGGDLPPYHAMAVILPDRDLTIYVMVNSIDGVGSFGLTDIIAKAVRAFSLLKGQAPVAPVPERSPLIDPSDYIRDSLPGYYASPAGLIRIKRKGGQLKIHTFNKWFDLKYHRDGSLTLGYKILGLVPLKLPVFDDMSISMEEIGGTPSLNLRLQGILISPSVRVEPVDIDSRWIARSGRYEAIHSEVMAHFTDFRLELDRGSGFYCLYLKSDGKWTAMPLQTLDGERARVLGVGRGLGGLIQVTTVEGEEIVSFQNFELRKRG